MQLFKIFTLLVIFLFFTVSNFAQNNQKKIQDITSKLFELSKTNQFEKAANYIVYNGNDKTRDMQEKINYNTPKEKSKVNRICKKIGSFLKISDSYSFGKFYSEKEKWGIASKQEVLLLSGKQKITTIFVFIKIGKEYLLADID